MSLQIWMPLEVKSSIVNTYDPNIYVEFDGSAWIRIFHHSNPTNNGLFTSSDSFTTSVYKDANRWFNCSLLNQVTDGKWELMVKQKTTSDATETKYKWIQIVNPYNAVYEDVTSDKINKIDVPSGAVAAMGGLYKLNSSTYFCIVNGTKGNWFGAIGAWSTYSSGIPGYPNTAITTGYLDLYLKVNVTDLLRNLGCTGSLNFTWYNPWKYEPGKVTSNCLSFYDSLNPTLSTNIHIKTKVGGFSLSFWFKFLEGGTLDIRLNNTEQTRLNIDLSSGRLGIAFIDKLSLIELTPDNWYHITVVVSTSPNIKVSAYVNGELTKSYNANTAVLYLTYFYIAGTKSLLNDIRVYDQALSVEEVKNLAKGLMLHYTLSRPCDNLLRNSYVEKSWSSTSTGSVDNNYSQDTITPAADSYYTMSFYAKSNKNSTGNFITYLYNNNSGRQCDSVKGYIDGELKFTGSASDGSCTMPTYTDWHRYVIVRHFNSTATALTKQNVFRIYNAGSSGLTMYIKQAKIELGNKATSWTPNMTDALYKHFDINTALPSSYLVNASAVNIGSASSTGQWMYATFTPASGGNFQPRIHRVRFKVTVLAGTVTSVTILFYNLSTSTGNTRVDAPIVNGYVDILITPSSAIPNLLIYAGVAGVTANNHILIENVLVFDQFNVSDNSGYGNNGLAINITNVYSDTPRYQTSYPFNGSNSYIYLPKDAARPKDAITISVWAYMDDWSTFAGRLISCTEGGGWNFEPNSGKMSFAIGTGISSNTYISVNSVTTLSQLSSGWHHFVGTYDGLSSKLYIDGELETTVNKYSSAIPVYYADNYTFVGAEAGGNTTTPAGNYFNGRISDVRIYATALSAANILELYQVSISIDKNYSMHCYELVEV